MSSSKTQSIAILGMACRFPDADSPDAFWHNLAAGVASIHGTPPSRWPIDPLFAPPPYQPGKSVSKWGGFLADIQRFDAAFFNIPAAEAQVMDPQQRILLELAYETLERSGYHEQRRAGLRISVFLGIGQNGYSELTVPLLRSGQPTHPMLVTHNIRNLVAGQIAHSLNLTGPALVIDTACSSSLVALHLARQSLRAGDCDLALVGGINLNITATPFVAFSSAGVLSSSAHTYVFDERADGFVLGEGGGMILLGLLDRTTAPGDPVLGVIKGSAINNDGRSLGLITPSPSGQEAVLRAAYASADIDPATVTYIEAHGTGTRIGDVVEARSLTRFFPQPPATGVRYLGSVKPNVGHLLSAAGMPSLIKVLLAFQHRQLPPTLDSTQVRPALKLDRAGFAINQSLIDWLPTTPDQPLRAGVSGFGFGGTNAHIVLEAAPPEAVAALKTQAKIHTFARTPFWVESVPTPSRSLVTPASNPIELTQSVRNQVFDKNLVSLALSHDLHQSYTIPAPSVRTMSEADVAVDEWLQQVVWQAQALPPNQTTPFYNNWLILSITTPAAYGLAHILAQDLQAKGGRTAHQHWTAGATLATNLVPTDQPWGLILVGPVEPVAPLDSRAALDRGLEQGLFALYTLVQPLLAMAPTQRPAGLWVITAGAQAVDKEDCIAPERAALTGLAFALGDEMADPPCLVVDLPPTEDAAEQSKILLHELSVAARRAVVAWRVVDKAWVRLVRRLESVHPISTRASFGSLRIQASIVGGVPTGPSAIPLNPNFSLSRTAPYLITGGATGIGAALARSLAAYGVPLILTGRTPILRDPQRAALVTELRKQGATVEYIVADITQANEVTALFDYICTLYGAPAGVIHAAGIVRPQPLRSKSRADFQVVLDPKVMGAWLLAQEMQRRAIQPDCFVLFSSIASLLPGFSGGLSDYAAANAFLDALATVERTRGVACTVLNWSVWAETGMGAHPLLLQHLATQGLAGLTTAEGVSAFYRALALNQSQVVILKPSTAAVPLPAKSMMVASHERGRKVTVTGQRADCVDRTAPRPVTVTSFPEFGDAPSLVVEAPQLTPSISIVTTRSFAEIETILQTLLATVLKVEPSEVSKIASFMSLGIDSMDALDLVLKLESAGFGSLPATLFFEYQTITDLARYLAIQAGNLQATSPNNTPILNITNHVITNHPITNHVPTFPLTPIQRAFAITHQLYPERPAVAFLRQTGLGTLDFEILQQAIAIIATRHPILRARFPAAQMVAANPQQSICPPDSPGIIPVIEVIDEMITSSVDSAAEVAALETALINRSFDLDQGSPWRLALAVDQGQAKRWHLLLAIHHIAGDAWSLRLVAQELWAVYTALVTGARDDLPLPQNTFQEAVADQQKRAALDVKTQTWWRQQLTQYAPALPLRLPFDRNPEQFTPEEWAKTYQAAHASHLTPTTTAALIHLAATHELSLFHLVLAAYLRCLHRWSNLPYLIINVADAQRPTHLPGIMEIVGSFADTLPLGLAMQLDESALDLATRIRHGWLAIQPAKTISSLELAALLAEIAPRSGSDQPRTVSPIGFSFARFAATLPADCPIEVIDLFGRTATAALRLSLVGWEFAGALHFSWNYLAPLFSPATITLLADHFVHELEQLAPYSDYNEEGGTPRAASHEAGALWARTPHSYDNDEEGGTPRAGRQDNPFVPVHTLVQAQCRRTPTAVAVWEAGATLTYDELDRRSDQVAGALSTLGVKIDDTVGLLGQPSSAAIVLLLGIAKVGATWVPLDPDHPPARNADQLQQAATQVVLFPAPFAANAQAINIALAGSVQLYALDDLDQVATNPLPTDPLLSDALAYIIFTSGSTGRPKGVPITHGALANYIGWAVETFGYGPTDRVMQATSLCFDASMRQIFAPLVTGGTVVPVARALVNDPLELLALLQQVRITIWSSVPALWSRLLAAIETLVSNGTPLPDLSHLRWIQVGGEALSAQLVRHWFDCYGNQQQLVNLYGPTETTINATYYLIKARPADDEAQIPIGYPVRGAQLRVLDAASQPCPPGIPGELYIGGVGLSPGYLHDQVRTQEQFIYDSQGQRFYRSGDRVQQRKDGALFFLGRIDDQVKVRGYRIELGEIEATLCQHPAIRLAAVIVRQPTPEEQRLVAYLECYEPSPDEATLRQWLRTRLPAYMLPHHFYQLPRLPLTTNGKLDRHQLATGLVEGFPLPHQSRSDAPQTATEQLLARLWQKVLDLDVTKPIERDDDFFALGGDSLQAIQLFVELAKERQTLPRAAYLYRYRTLADLAQALDDYRPEPTSPLPIANATTDPFGVSLAQAGFLLLRAIQADQATSWCAAFCLVGPLQADPFIQAIQRLVVRHPMLRTIFPAVAKSATSRTPYQQVLSPDRTLPVAFTDWQRLSATEQPLAIDTLWYTLRARRFDPSQWPLIEMYLCRLAPDHHLWFVATDHLIGDGFSGWLLGQELLQFYDALVKGQTPQLPPLRSTFRDYVTLQQQHERTLDPAAEAHWRKLFATPYQPPTLGNRQNSVSMPAQKATAAWTHQSLDCDPTLVQQLEQGARQLGVTPYELLLTLFFRQLQRLTGQADLVVGSAVAGRDEPLPDIVYIFGTFATALPLRVQLVDAPWQAQVQQVAAAFGAARAHSLSPRRIAQLMHPQTPFTTALGAQFLFSYMDFSALGELQSDTLRVDWARSQTELQPPSTSSDLVLTGRKVEGRLRLVFAAPTAVLSAEALQSFVERFKQDLHQSIAPPVLPSVYFTRTPLEKGLHPDQSVLPLDAALIAYLPPFSQIQAALGPVGAKVNADTVRQMIFPRGDARWLERLDTPMGSSGAFFIPWFADELATIPAEALRQAVVQAIDQAGKFGAQVVSLAGMLPAYTRYGYALLEAGATTPRLTTGHSTTVVAVVKSVLAALAATGQNLATLQLGCLGLGSIGSAALQLLLKVAGHPAGLTLCDVEGSGERLRALVTTLRQELDYQGQVRIIEVADHTNNAVPDELYAVDLVIGATSRPNVLDVDRLAPGTVVVDDSFPSCFAVERAIARMKSAQDVLLVGGGLLDCGPIQRTIYLPLAHPTLGEQIAGQLSADAVASCQLEALLWARQPTLPLTLGVATLSGALAYWHGAETMGITAAPLHLREFRIEASLLHTIRKMQPQKSF